MINQKFIPETSISPDINFGSNVSWSIVSFSISYILFISIVNNGLYLLLNSSIISPVGNIISIFSISLGLTFGWALPWPLLIISSLILFCFNKHQIKGNLEIGLLLKRIFPHVDWLEVDYLLKELLWICF